jgi:MGT family glycosyltransferase
MTLRTFGRGAGTFNETRRALGLEPVGHPFDQLKRLARHLVLTSAAFDFQSSAPPAQLAYAGPELDDPEWIAEWRSPWSASDPRPLVLVGFSTTFQNQTDALCRVVEALRDLDVRAVVTAGPAVAVASLPHAANVYVCQSAPHSAVMKEAAVVVTHAGHGTVIRALAAGVPLVCMPMGRDQNDNAARVVFHGAGTRIDASASPTKIREAVRLLLESPRYRARARRLGERVVEDARRSRAVPLLEEVAAQRAHAAPR